MIQPSLRAEPGIWVPSSTGAQTAQTPGVSPAPGGEWELGGEVGVPEHLGSPGGGGGRLGPAGTHWFSSTSPNWQRCGKLLRMMLNSACEMRPSPSTSKFLNTDCRAGGT